MAFKLYTLLSALLVNEITHAARVLSRYRDARRTRFLRIRLRLTVRVKKRPASHRSSSGRDGQITGCHPEDPRCSCIIFIQLLFYKPGFRLSTGRRTAFRYRTSLVTVYPQPGTVRTSWPHSCPNRSQTSSCLDSGRSYCRYCQNIPFGHSDPTSPM